ncbi:MAG: MBOAT family protein, partial [Clostridia bacterium]|nr:MBOAT family protein [Clostridia bacterium]
GLTFRQWGSMLTVWNFGDLSRGVMTLGLDLADWIIVLCGCLLMAIIGSLSAKIDIRERLYEKPILSWILFGTLFLVILLFGAYGVGYDASQFIYNQF